MVRWRTSLSRVFKPFVFMAAAIYFLMASSFSLSSSLFFAGWRITGFSKARGRGLCPFARIQFIVPVILLEPVKPVAAYLTATGHVVGGLMVLIVGELLKLLLIERLFRVSRDKLMSIPVFAWCYDKFCQGQDRVISLLAWQLMRRWSFNAKHAVQRYVLEFRTAQKRKMLSWQSR